MKDLNKLQTFVHVVQHKSFTKAARDLRMTSSVVSKHINELENMLGVSLLKRSTRGVSTTEVGEIIFRNCVDLIAGIDKVITDARNAEAGPYGYLRVQCDTGYAQLVVMPLLPKFMARYPHVRVELSVENVTAVPLQLGYDIILCGDPPAAPGLTHRQLGPVPHVVCASPDYFRDHGSPKRPPDLRDHNCLLDPYCTPKEWFFKRGTGKIMVDVKGAFCSNNTVLLTRAALLGMGIVRVPLYIARPYLKEGSLRSIFDDLLISRERINAYFSRTKHLPAKTSAFIDFLGAEIAKRAQ